jgi:3-methyladenine DNA glycosylase/8-oxoguanine DNA glycosylase
MTKLPYQIQYEIRPAAPYNFRLTIKKPAGWSLFTPFEIYDNNTMWTSTHLDGALTGIRLVSKGTTKNPRINAKLFLKNRPGKEQLSKIKNLLAHEIGADDDLSGFYGFAKKDRILKHAVADLYGMHNTDSSTIFPDALLSILLQMTTLKRSNEMMDCVIKNYGELAEFDGKKIYAWPTPKGIAGHDATELSRICKLGYRAKHVVNLSRKLARERFPTTTELEMLKPEEAKAMLLELPGIGDYSADIINPHGGFPIDVWSAEVFGKLFYGKEPENNRDSIARIKQEGLRRWGEWSWMAFFYVVQDLENLSKKLRIKLRLS